MKPREAVVVALLVAGCCLVSALSARAAAPPAPKLEDLPLQDNVSQYGITWTFDKKVHVGQFVTGDYYVVGRVTVTAISPAPEERRNGSMLNPDPGEYHGYGEVKNDPAMATLRYKAELAAKLPIAMKPGDSLVSTITRPDTKGWITACDGIGSAGTPLVASVLTCLESPAPPDTFRPCYCGRQKKLYHFSDLHLEVLPAVKLTAGAPKIEFYNRVFERPWLDHVYDWGSRELHPTENMPDYGQRIGKRVGEASLLLISDLPLDQKKKLLVGFVQYGIDLWGCIERGIKGWPQKGGFGSGRKWPLIFTGLLLKDEAMQKPKAEFGEDQGTAFGPCWTGANVVFTGHSGKDGWGDLERAAYEHLPPAKWLKLTSETYRRNSVSDCWVAQALAARLMKAEKVWDHDAFFAYVDRWMMEDQTKPLAELKKACAEKGWGFPQYWKPDMERTTKFVQEMWDQYRPPLAAPMDGWKPKAQPRGEGPKTESPAEK